MRCSLCHQDRSDQPDLFVEPSCPKCAMRLGRPPGAPRPPAPSPLLQPPAAPRATIVLVSCGARKRLGCYPARDLYTGSLFQAARRYAEATGHPWRILSAEHALLDPDRLTWTYDRQLDAGHAPAWGGKVLAQLAAAFPGHDLDLVVLAGELYAEALRPQLARTWTLATPLAGLPLGRRLRFLSQGPRSTT